MTRSRSPNRGYQNVAAGQVDALRADEAGRVAEPARISSFGSDSGVLIEPSRRRASATPRRPADARR
ncbi:MAG: hypothetical protein MZV64_42420 [Ignavibacteriales bacterium]|nr:hypothetical protein [Ignavibacteriales bacterium]